MFNQIEPLKRAINCSNLDLGILNADNVHDVTKEFAEIHFPIVEIKELSDINWLINIEHMSANGTSKISQAIQQIYFKMNENNAIARIAETSGKLTETCRMSESKSVLIFDKPFLLWIERPGMRIPLFAAYVDSTSWKSA